MQWLFYAREIKNLFNRFLCRFIIFRENGVVPVCFHFFKLRAGFLIGLQERKPADAAISDTDQGKPKWRFMKSIVNANTGSMLLVLLRCNRLQRREEIIDP